MAKAIYKEVVMAKWLSNTEYWARDIFISSPYETGGIARVFHETLDPSNPTICPHCNGNNARLLKEGRDLYCLICGWRESQYFNEKLNNLIKWLIGRERRFGAPILLSDSETPRNSREVEKVKLRKYRNNHKDDAREYNKRYREEHSERLKEKARLYYQSHKVVK